jgi:hypothetical protein
VNDQPSYGQHPAVLSQPIAAYNENTNANNNNMQQQSSTPEGALVNKICTPSGLRAVPESVDLKAFVAAAAAATINVTEVSQLLEEKCEKGPWQPSLRALCAIVALIEGGGEVGGEAAVYFQAHPGTVRKMAGHPQATVRQRADRVLKLIGADTLPCSDDGKKNSNDNNSGTEADLSDLLFGDDGGGSAAVEVVVPSTTAAGVIDLFSGLDISSTAAAAAPLQQAPPAPSSGSGIADPFFVEHPGIDSLNITPQKPSPTTTMMMGRSNGNSDGMKSMMTGGGGSGSKDGAFKFMESQLNELKVTKKK